jgi:tRNA threonylcarbamoyladenosine modification (KEOPS) complex  Pcc1 subunit
MECSARLFAKGDPERLFECLAAEETGFDRSSFTVKKMKDGVEFDIRAKDAVALRATLNSISQLLIIFEGARKPE